jgi:hypothetical protein
MLQRRYFHWPLCEYFQFNVYIPVTFMQFGFVCSPVIQVHASDFQLATHLANRFFTDSFGLEEDSFCAIGAAVAATGVILVLLEAVAESAAGFFHLQAGKRYHQLCTIYC